MTKIMTDAEVQDLITTIRQNEKMTEEDFVEHCLTNMMGGWVPVATYLRMFPDETMNAIHKRVQQGGWTRQVHYAAPKGSTSWINLPAVRLWLEGKLEGPRTE